MLVDRIVKETTDVSRIIVDLDEFLDDSEVVTQIVSASITQGTTGWGFVPYPPGAAPPPYDPTPLLFHSYTLDAVNRTLIFFVKFGTAGLFYTCTFVIAGTSVRQTTIEVIVQITGIPPVQLDIPLPANPAAPAPTHALPISGGQMTGPLYLFEDPVYPTEAATKEYVDLVAGVQGGPFLSLRGGIMQGPLVLYASPVNANDAATKAYVDNYFGLHPQFLPVSGGQMTGPLLLANDPLQPMESATKRYVDSADALRLLLTGGVLTGPLVLAADPTGAMQAATKEYVDNSIAASTASLVVVGDTAPALHSGTLWFDSVGTQLYIGYNDGTSSQWVATNNIDGSGAITDAPMDSTTYGRNNAAWVNVLGTSGGTVTGPLIWTATGSTTPRSAQDRSAETINVMDYGAKGDARALTAGVAMTAGSAALTASGGNFTATDVGKTIIVTGAGASGAPLITTIAAFTSAGAVTLAVAAGTTITNGRLLYGSDDTAAVTACIAAARTTGLPAVFDAKTYLLASQTASISVTNVSLIGAGQTTNFFPFAYGTMFVIFNTATPAFSGLAGTRIDHIAFWYPGIDNSQATPTSYPPTFQADAASAGAVNNYFNHVRCMNAWQFVHVTTVGSLARSIFSNCLVYGVDAVFWMESGFADTVQLNNCYIGPGAFGSEATAAPGNMWHYTCQSGSVFRLNPGGGSYANCDGLLWCAGIVGSYRYAIQLMSGLLDVSVIDGVMFDGVSSVLDVSGSAQVTSTSLVGGTIYSTNPASGATAFNTFNFTTTHPGNDLTISGVFIAYAQGNIIYDSTGNISSLSLGGCRLANWGRSTTAATYYVFAASVGEGSHLAIVGNMFYGNSGGTSNSVFGLFLSLATNANVAVCGNTFLNCTRCINIQGAAGSALATGNISHGSGFSNNDATTGTALYVDVGNAWDGRPTSRLPTASGTGTTVAPGSTNFAGSVTLGAGLTATTVTFTTPLPYPPKAVTLTGVGDAVQLSATPTATSFSMTAATAATSFHYQVAL